MFSSFGLWKILKTVHLANRSTFALLFSCNIYFILFFKKTSEHFLPEFPSCVLRVQITWKGSGDSLPSTVSSPATAETTDVSIPYPL